jgi:DnaJ-class molecular chaperone
MSFPHCRARSSRRLARSNAFDDELKADARSDQSSSTQQEQPQKWFEVLKVAPAASLEEIKAAYRSKIFSYHPDRVSSLA